MTALLRNAIATAALAVGVLATAGCGGADDQAADPEPRAAEDTAEGTGSSSRAVPECAAGDLTATVAESTAPNDTDKLYRLTFSAADGTTACHLGGPPQAMVFRDDANARLPVTVRTDPGDTPRKEVLVDADNTAEVYLTTPIADANTAPARTDFTMPFGGPDGTTFSLEWAGTIGAAVTVTPATMPVS